MFRLPIVSDGEAGDDAAGMGTGCEAAPGDNPVPKHAAQMSGIARFIDLESSQPKGLAVFFAGAPRRRGRPGRKP